MARVERDEEREQRIHMEAIVDAYGPEEQAMGWYCYLEDRIAFPVRAVCIAQRRISPLQIGETVEVTAMAPEEECQHEMFVEIHWRNRHLAVPLMQLEAIDADDETEEAIGDWHYWTARGYELG